MWKEVRSDDCNQKFRYCIGGSVVLVHAMCRFFYFVSGKQMAVLSCSPGFFQRTCMRMHDMHAMLLKLQPGRYAHLPVLICRRRPAR